MTHSLQIDFLQKKIYFTYRSHMTPRFLYIDCVEFEDVQNGVLLPDVESVLFFFSAFEGSETEASREGGGSAW